MAQVYLTKPQNANEASPRLCASLSEASSHATDERKAGRTTEISRATTKNLPIRELLAGAFNHDMSIFEDVTVVKTVQGMKHPRPLIQPAPEVRRTTSA